MIELDNAISNLVIAEEDKQHVLQFAQANYRNENLFEKNGPSRQFCILNQIYTPISNMAYEFRLRKFKELGIDNFEEEPNFGIFLGVNNEGGYVHKHRDWAPDTHYHIRLNFLISKPIAGGVPVIEGRPLEINENESWINFASEWDHYSTPVEGQKLRVVLSLGAFIEKEQVVKNLLKYS